MISRDAFDNTSSNLSRFHRLCVICVDDKEIIPVNCKNMYMKELGVKGEDPPASVLWKYFLNRVKDNLHMVLAFSPVNIKFR